MTELEREQAQVEAQGRILTTHIEAREEAWGKQQEENRRKKEARRSENMAMAESSRNQAIRKAKEEEMESQKRNELEMKESQDAHARKIKERADRIKELQASRFTREEEHACSSDLSEQPGDPQQTDNPQTLPSPHSIGESPQWLASSPVNQAEIIKTPKMGFEEYEKGIETQKLSQPQVSKKSACSLF
jgi:hypothetical protein